MKIVKVKWSFTHDGVNVNSGEVIEMNDHEAQRMINLNFCEEVAGEEVPEKIEPEPEPDDNPENEENKGDTSEEESEEGKLPEVDKMTREELMQELSANAVPFKPEDKDAYLKKMVKALREG